MTFPWWCASLAAMAVLVVLSVTSPARAEGVGPCMSAASHAYQDCKAGCRESYQLAKDTCHNRDHVCVEGCRDDRQSCRQPTVDTLNAALDGIEVDLMAAKQICRQLYGDGTAERDTCIDNAQVAAFIRRKAALKAAKPGLALCRTQFKGCVMTNCPPLSVPDPVGVKACKDDARDLFMGCVADCVEARQLARDTCLNRDHACVEGCRTQRSDCLSGPFATLAGLIAACNATRQTAIENCPPPGNPARDACVLAAQVMAFQCRDGARESVAGDIQLCRDQFRTCAQACPPPGGSPSGAFL